MIESTTSSVLLVDDQPAKLLTYQVILSQLDVRLVTASSAREALENLLKGDFAVVLIDVCMPELDGFELAALIREHPRFRTTAIIFVSGVHLSDLDRIRGYELGAMDYVPVPVIPEILRAKVKAFVDLHRTTRQLERLNAELEERVAARTAELQLASERKDEFLAVLAHELRNPLAAIHTASQVIDVAMDSAQRTKVGAVIQRQVTHLVRLIDDLIDMSRISRGVIGLRRERVGIGPIIEQAVESTRPVLDARGHRLAVHIPAHAPDVYGDGARLAQVVGNLLTNAAKFTPPGGDITLRVTHEADAVVIRVIDTGVGVDPSKLSYIFELFTQEEQPDGHNASGLGIGLALVRRIVEMHDGQVSAHSQGAGTGTEVIVRLPALPPALPKAEEPAVAEVDTPRGPSGTCILVVDDNADAAFVLALMLRHAGHTVEIAGNGEQALRTGPAFDPRVVLLDLGMPGMDGFETARRIRQQRWGQGVVLVAVTGWGLPEDRRRTQAAGFNAHMVKPVDDDQLLSVIDDLLSRPAQ